MYMYFVLQYTCNVLTNEGLRVVVDPHAPFDEVFNRYTPFMEVFVVCTGCASQGNLIDNGTHMHELTCFDSSDLDSGVPELVHSD